MHTWIRMKMNIYNIYTVCLPVLVSIDDNNRMGRGWGGDGAGMGHIAHCQHRLAVCNVSTNTVSISGL